MSKRLSIDEVGEMLAASAATPRRTLTPVQVASAAADLLRKNYPELLSVMPSEKEWATKVMAFLRLNGPAVVVTDLFNAESLVEWALASLITSGTLQMVCETPESLRDLEELRRDVAIRGFNLGQQEEVTDEADAVPQPVALDPIDECAADYRALCSSDFKMKWMKSSTRQVFDRAVAEGKI